VGFTSADLPADYSGVALLPRDPAAAMMGWAPANMLDRRK
jgi:hypothetical protein